MIARLVPELLRILVLAVLIAVALSVVGWIFEGDWRLDRRDVFLALAIPIIVAGFSEYQMKREKQRK